MNKPYAFSFLPVLLLTAVAVFGCRGDDVPVSAASPDGTADFTDQRLAGAWLEVSSPAGYEFTGDGRVLPLAVDNVNTLQVDNAEITGRYRTPAKGTLVISYTYGILRNQAVRDTTVEYWFSYEFTRGDSTLSLLFETDKPLPVPSVPELYVRKAIGSTVGN
jgi:hypothetical protein